MKTNEKIKSTFRMRSIKEFNQRLKTKLNECIKKAIKQLKQNEEVR